MKVGVHNKINSAQTIREYEVLHGIVLSKIVRHGHGVCAAFIGTRGKDAQAEYTVNNASTLYVKHSTAPRSLKRSDGLGWNFTFSCDHLRRIHTLMDEKDLNLVLVCAGKDVSRISEWNICMIFRNEVSHFLDLSRLESPQTIKVMYLPGTGRSLRVGGALIGSTRVIPRSRLQDWQPPVA